MTNMYKDVKSKNLILAKSKIELVKSIGGFISVVKLRRSGEWLRQTASRPIIYPEDIKETIKFLSEIQKEIDEDKIDISDSIQPFHTEKSENITELENILEINTEFFSDDNLSEMKVIFLAGKLWREISQKYDIIQIQEFNPKKYPDMVALKKCDNGLIKEINIEFEIFSSNFLSHGHPINRCDIIICWKNDWIDCPKHINIVQLCDFKITK